LLLNYPWPGNVRELENALIRAMVFCHSDCIGIGDLPEELQLEDKEEEEAKFPVDKQELKQMKKQAQQKIKEEMEKKFIVEALRQGEGNILRSSAKVGMDRRQFQNLIKKYGISKTDFDRNGCE
jgi:DNA-binding NtrC family response regulator